MVDAAAVARSLGETGRPFGMVPRDSVVPQWGELFAALDGDGERDYVHAVELIYEGYLLHYRSSRLGSAADAETRLLAGDCYYARGLRLIAARGDAEAVGVLARLMAACSHLRVLGAPFAADNALWAYTMGALAALRRGAPASVVGAPYDRLDAAFAGGAETDVRALLRAAVPDLALPRPAALHDELAGGPAIAPSPPPTSARSMAPVSPPTALTEPSSDGYSVPADPRR